MSEWISCKDKLNKLHAKMVIQGNKGSISEIIEKAIDKLYEEWSQEVEIP
jgi:hypothetical protein